MLEIPIEKIVRQKRKTISIEITDNATVLIRAPYYASEKDIERALAKHLSWIEQRLEKAREKKTVASRKFVQGEKFLYLGKLYPLYLSEKQKQNLIFDGKYFWLKKDVQQQGREVFEKWYRKQAREVFSARIKIWSALMGLEFNRLKLSSASTRWGSCSSKGNINLVWRLVMAPQGVIDYVIVHELAHLRHMNHSKDFWNYVAKYYPDYKNAKQWLVKYGHFLVL